MRYRELARKLISGLLWAISSGNLYEARLNIGDRCQIEWFVGPHTINGKGTFDFLHKHLNWPKR